MTAITYHHCQPDQLMELVDHDNQVFLELTEIFMRESTEIFAHLRTAAAAADQAQMGFRSHSLKGTVGPLGADALVEMLLAVELECSKKQCTCDVDRIAAIHHELQQVKDEMQHFINKL
ncbi:HPt (histidine-containing phosphotransfer) domain-containing protein [Actimicrobium sp. GrIS 1.19]|uniref:Hpt domain-containing protein n=1 Tax=Actimicrobium sp. GrIS 1.19 TaxID=3071708 RepID=UPI002E016565|nr:HPt (histidine-containing phosphotransfer) domain-containing protein [Actimicrobium sp. GrIS 1.19]